MSRALLGFTGLIAFGLAIVAWSGAPSSADPAATAPMASSLPAAKPGDKPVRWQDDPVCQMVFFAVLEGLYRDGVQDDVVDAIVPRVKEEASLRTSFVAACPLCHPVFEALRTYQARPAFVQDAAGTKTFGKGLDPQVAEKLRSKERMTRLQALAPVVKTWVEAKLASMHLPPAEKEIWVAKLRERSNQGKAQLVLLMRNDPDYKEGWSIYWGCAACNGVVGATNH